MSDLVERLFKRATIRRQIPRSEPDRIADLLEEAGREIMNLTRENLELAAECNDLSSASISIRAARDLRSQYPDEGNL
jgi:hypothetical protein